LFAKRGGYCSAALCSFSSGRLASPSARCQRLRQTVANICPYMRWAAFRLCHWDYIVEGLRGLSRAMVCSGPLNIQERKQGGCQDPSAIISERQKPTYVYLASKPRDGQPKTYSSLIQNSGGTELCAFLVVFPRGGACASNYRGHLSWFLEHVSPTRRHNAKSTPKSTPRDPRSRVDAIELLPARARAPGLVAALVVRSPPSRSMPRYNTWLRTVQSGCHAT
jgi:hypothetical protein